MTVRVFHDRKVNRKIQILHDRFDTDMLSGDYEKAYIYWSRESEKTIMPEPGNSQLKIFYFSGTGNALRVARWFTDEAEKNGCNTSLVNIADKPKRRIQAPSENEILGFCSPTHGFNFPPVSLKFLWKFPRGNNKFFIINTRAGMKLWKFHLCGLSGVAQLFAALVLKIKGYRIVGMHPVDLPSNWISIHPGLRAKVISSIHQRCEKRIRKLSAKILSGGKGYRALLDIIQDLAISPIALGYYFVGRYVLAKSFIASNKCSMCRLCIQSCPVEAIKEIDNRPYWSFRCESCMRCMNNCPERAIQTAHGFVIGSMYLIFTLGMQAILSLIYDLAIVEKIPLLENGMVEFLIASALCIPFLWLSYRLVHYLMKYRFFNNLLVYTSLTVFKFWRRYRPKMILNS